MARLSSATWRPIPVNYTKGGQARVDGVVVHIMAGTLAGTDSWFRNSRAQASSHFGTGKTGALYQWVDTADRAWAQAGGNSSWLSVENEGQGGDKLTDAQMNCVAEVLAWAHKVYDVPLQVANSPSGKGLGYHAMGGSAWGGHTSCPGPKIVAQLPEIVARARRLVAGQSIEEDPLAGMTKKDIFEAVWNTDAVPAPETSSTIKKNPTWQAVSVLTDISNRVRATEATVKAQAATIKTMAEALAKQDSAVDVDALVQRITSAIESVTVHLDVDDEK
ncbi:MULTISPECIES: N-acetylmuramoyl-L-alanine amidase [unclassified Streptomyces]|uniref:N-acetylmuramoyl-L-alanine amidase n=1 Tax=unclassified Streptomyces TaxID=2593676 RepID=UPI003BB73031